MPNQADMQEKIQQIELETVKSITELKSDVKNLTRTISSLESTITSMTMNFVRTDTYLINQKQIHEELDSLRSDLRASKRTGVVKGVLWSVLTSLVTVVVTYIVMKALGS